MVRVVLLALMACGERAPEGPSREEAEAAQRASVAQAPPEEPPGDGALVQVEVANSDEQFIVYTE